MVCLALELVGHWVVLGFSVGMEVFDELLSINVSWSQEFSGVLRIWADEKFLHSEGHPERFTELHGEEKREEGVRGDPNEMRWDQKRKEQASQ